jgi:hypothetical protein
MVALPLRNTGTCGMQWMVAAFLLLMPLSVARAAEPVDLELVLVTDVSRSIDDSEFDLEKHGYADAFVDHDVLAAIKGGPVGAIAVSYVEFAGSYEVKTVLDWTVIRDAASGQAFADRLLAAQRSFYGRTSISAGIDLAMKNFTTAGFEAQRRVIDVCGDGTNNNDHPVSYTFAHVQPPGGLAKYYRDNVTGGTGTFVMEVHDFHSFGAAMTRKLINEIASQMPSQGKEERLGAAQTRKGAAPL